MKTFVIELLKNNIPPHYYYHSYEHTLYVMDKAIEIGREENCTGHEIDLVSAAALWHDTGFIKTYIDHEKAGCLLAREYLPGYGYSAEDIDKICGMIMATSIPQSPKNKLEEIVADADLEYLGTNDAAVKAEHLFKEWQHLDPSLTREEWNRKQISFLQKHHYFTRFCKEKKERSKSAYLQNLVDNIE
ncbi:MAG: HD domain-containing protein [Chitinophagales bacterium]